MSAALSKSEYLYKMFSKRTKNKDRENYIINRIWSLLNDDRIFPITQQQIMRTNQKFKRALVDLYFPQINLGIEVDEDHHLSNSNKDFDRFRDIREVNENYYELRIKVDSNKNQDIEFIHAQVDMAVSLIKRKFLSYKFEGDWFDDLKNPQKVAINQGFLSSKQNLSFSTHVQVLQTFGFTGRQMMRAGYPLEKLGYSNDYHVWFPTIDQGENSASNSYQWTNSIEEIENELYITESLKNQQDIGPEIGWNKRVVFAKIKDPIFAKIAYKFVGVFLFDNVKSNQSKIYYKRISDTFQLNQLT